MKHSHSSRLVDYRAPSRTTSLSKQAYHSPSSQSIHAKASPHCQHHSRLRRSSELLAFVVVFAAAAVAAVVDESSETGDQESKLCAQAKEHSTNSTSNPSGCAGQLQKTVSGASGQSGSVQQVQQMKAASIWRARDAVAAVGAAASALAVVAPVAVVPSAAALVVAAPVVAALALAAAADQKCEVIPAAESPLSHCLAEWRRPVVILTRSEWKRTTFDCEQVAPEVALVVQVLHVLSVRFLELPIPQYWVLNLSRMCLQKLQILTATHSPTARWFPSALIEEVQAGADCRWQRPAASYLRLSHCSSLPYSSPSAGKHRSALGWMHYQYCLCFHPSKHWHPPVCRTAGRVLVTSARR